jgi:hypothetical protein
MLIKHLVPSVQDLILENTDKKKAHLLVNSPNLFKKHWWTLKRQNSKGLLILLALR